MSTINFDPVAFREQFPAFQCTPPISDATLQMYFNNATLYISNRYRSCWGAFTVPQRTESLYLMTAHLTAISRMTAQGQTGGILTSATIDKVTVTIQPPPETNQWQYWLQSTPYGQQLLALLQVISVGGRYIGGSPQRSAFRGAGGFWN